MSNKTRRIICSLIVEGHFDKETHKQYIQATRKFDALARKGHADILRLEVSIEKLRREAKQVLY